MVRPAVGLIVLGWWLVWVGWRSGARAAQILAVAALSEGVLVWNLGLMPAQQALAAALPLAAILGGIGLVAVAWRRDLPVLALVGLALALSPVAVLTMSRATQVQVAVVDLCAIVVLAGAVVWPRRVPAGLAAAAGGMLLMVAGWVRELAQPWSTFEVIQVQVACVVPLVLIVLVAWRQRSWLSALPVVLLIGWGLVLGLHSCATWLWMWRPRNPGWWLVSAAFALLVAGLVAGRRRLAAAVEVQAEPDQGVEQPSSTAVPGP